MTHLPSQVLAQYLVGQAFGVWWDTKPRPAASVFRVSYGGMAEEDDRAITVYDIAAKREDKRSHRSGEISEFPGFQLRTRGLTEKEAGKKARDIAEHLDGLWCQGVTLDGRLYKIQNCSRQTSPAFLMEEERNRRRVWVFNGFLTLTEEP